MNKDYMMLQKLLLLSSEVWKSLTYTPRPRALYALLPLAALHTFECYAPALTITQPGLYTLGEDITFSPGAADSIISIQSSDVTLDLGGRSIIQGNATAGVDGIAIAEGLQRVTIKNGTIRNVTGTGITISNSATSPVAITISDMLFYGCQTRGISALGLTYTLETLIENCSFVDCILPAAGDNVIFMLMRNSIIRNIHIANNSTASGNKTLFALGASECIIDTISVTGFSTNGSLQGFSTSPFSRNLVKNCTFTNVSSLVTGSVTIFTIVPDNNIYMHCVAMNTSAVNNATFISATGGAGTFSDIYIGCTVYAMSSSTETANGFVFTNCQQCTFIDCLVQSVSAPTNSCNPYFLTTCSSCTLLRCSALNNSATGTTSQINNFNIDTCTSCILRDCIAGNNRASGTSSISRGFSLNGSSECIIDSNAAYQSNGGIASVGYTQGGATNVFLRNVALRNGTTGPNQFAGFGVNQQQVFSLAASNSLTVPWTNVGLV